LTPEASGALEIATDLIGYGPYVERVLAREGQVSHATDNRVELDRARHALELAKAGRVVAVVSGGDPGVFAMAAALFEAVDYGDESDRAVTISVLPGVSAMQAAAARLGFSRRPIPAAPVQGLPSANENVRVENENVRK
jgi:precorrin-3B C17-methyltransferase